MARGFMEHYFDITFNDAIGEIAGNDERYAELQSVADEAVHTLTGIVGKSNTALWEQCEHTICVVRKIGKRCLDNFEKVTYGWLFLLERM